MAIDANINRIKFLRTKTAGSVPAASLLDEGELAINLADRTIYSKNGSNVVELGFGKGGSVSGAITAPQFNGPLVGNASTATKLQTARTISLTGSATGSISFDGSSNQSISVNVNKLDNLPTYAKSNSDSPTKWEQGIQSVFVSSSQGWPMPYGGVITARPYGNGGGTLQIMTAYGSDSGIGGGEIKIRTGDYSVSGNDGWTSWKTLVHSENVNNYSPTKTGTGASGTWAISVTGNSSTATRLQTARTINGVSFNGTTNIEVPIKTIRTTAIETDGLSESVFFRSDAGAGTLGIHIQNPTDSRYAYQLTQDSSYDSIGLKARVKSAGTWSGYKSLAFTDSDITGNAATATKLQTARTLSWTGDATGSLSFNGTANVSAVLTLANSGVTAGTYKSVTVDTKGRVTAGTNVITGLVTSTAASGTTNVATSNTNTYLNIVETIGSAATTVGTSTQVTGAGTVTVSSDTAGKLTITGSQNITGNAATATKLQTARTINGVSFDGTTNITIADSTKLPTAGGTITGNLTVNGDITNARFQSTSAFSFLNAGSAQSINTGGLLVSNSYADASKVPNNGIYSKGDIKTDLWAYASCFVGPLNGNADSSTVLKSTDNRNIRPSGIQNGTLSLYFTSQGGLTGATNVVYGDFVSLSSYHDSSGGSVNGLFFHKGTKRIVHYQSTFGSSTWATAHDIAYTSDNVASATKLQTARTINGVSFDGTANITIADNTKLPLTGGTITDTLTVAVGDTVGAFKKLIQGATSTDGGYLAVGNTASDKGYVEIGTIDDADTEIIARKRTSANGVLATVKILDQSNNSSFPGSITASGNITAYSDTRLKDNIIEIPDALNKVNQLKGVTFNRIDTNDKDKRYVGLIAQDVQSVMPEAVNVNDDEINTLSVDYQGLVGLLVEAIKELKTEIDELKEKVK